MLTGVGKNAIKLIDMDLSEVNPQAELVTFSAFRIKMTGTDALSESVTVGSEDANGSTVQEMSVSLSRNSTSDPLLSEPVLWQVTAQSVSGFQSLTGVVGGTVYATIE